MEFKNFKRTRHVFLTAFAVLCSCAFLFFLLRPPAPLYLGSDEEPFRSIVLPPKSVIALTYMDQGSAAMRLIDDTGTIFFITFPIDYDGVLDSYPKAYSGEINDPKMILLKDPSRAKKIVVRLLRDYAKEDQYGSVKTVLRVLTHRAVPYRIRRVFE